MTNVHFYVPNGDSSGPAVGYIAVATYHREQGGSGTSYVVIGPAVDHPLVDGHVTIDLEPNTSSNLWQVTERVVGGSTRLVSVPNSASVVEADSLGSIDGRTLPTEGEPEAAWWSALEDVAAGGTPGGGGGGPAVWGQITGTLSAQTDLNTVLGTKYVKPTPGIPKADLTTTVQSSLDKADSAVQSVAGLYTKPGTGIPKSDLAAAVQTSLGKADSAVQDVSGLIPASQKGAANGVAPLDSGSKVPAANIGTASTYGFATSADLDNTFAIASGAIPATQKGAVNGVATLGADGKLTAAQVPAGSGGAVSSVNSQTGGVVLTQDNIPDGTTAKQYLNTEKTKLAGIAAGATANQSDATTNAAIAAKYTKPGTGIPSTDLATAAQTSLSKADTAVQPAALTGKVNALGTLTGNWLGTQAEYDALGSYSSTVIYNIRN